MVLCRVPMCCFVKGGNSTNSPGEEGKNWISGVRVSQAEKIASPKRLSRTVPGLLICPGVEVGAGHRGPWDAGFKRP